MGWMVLLHALRSRVNNSLFEKVFLGDVITLTLAIVINILRNFTKTLMMFVTSSRKYTVSCTNRKFYSFIGVIYKVFLSSQFSFFIWKMTCRVYRTIPLFFIEKFCILSITSLRNLSTWVLKNYTHPKLSIAMLKFSN